MIVKTFKLLPDTKDISFLNFDQLEGGTIRIEMKIKGIHFKRIAHLSGIYPPCWTNEDSTFEVSMIDKEKSKDLEEIFKGYLLDNKICLDKSLLQS